MPAPSGPIRAIHGEIAGLVTEFILELTRVPRDRAAVARAAAVLDQAERRLHACFEAEELVVFPAVAPWLGGWNGPLFRECAEHDRLERALGRFRSASIRASAPGAVAEDWRVLRFVHGREIAAMLHAHAGREDGYILRVADTRLRGEPRRRLRAGVEAALLAHNVTVARDLSPLRRGPQGQGNFRWFKGF